ncbi:MAG TPA: DUF6064 family protein [Casimicrobiaceae bacterium]
MSEWWTYRPSSFLPFSPRTWFRLHELYNGEIWPLQLVALALGAAILVLAMRGGTGSGRWIAAILAACWTFVAWAFHYRHYATINWAASYFAVAFAIEALLLAWIGVVRGALAFAPQTAVQRAGVLLAAFALLAEPAIGPLLGRSWSQTEVFGTAPDPTAVATMGVLLAADRLCWPLLVVPLLWCAVSGGFQWAMALPDALVVPLLAATALLLALLRRS